MAPKPNMKAGMAWESSRCLPNSQPIHNTIMATALNSHISP